MTEDFSTVPRRLRRFYRKGMPIPEEVKNDSPRAQSNDVSDEMHEEPWMNPKPDTRNPRRRHTDGPPTPPPNVQAGGFERVVERTQEPAVTHVDKALGLEDKAKFVERLPTKGANAIQGEGKREEIEHTLKELKDLASLGNAQNANKGPASFHFTPVGAAPNQPSPIEMQRLGEGKSPDLSPTQLSPRERLEMRRQKTGQAPNEEPQGKPAPGKPASAPTTPASGSAPGHIRRRMGQVMSGTASEMGEEEEKAPSKNELDTTDFNDLLDNSKKKKKNSKSDEEDDLSIEDDFPLLDDEK